MTDGPAAPPPPAAAADEGPLTRRTSGVLAAVGAVSLLTAVALVVFSDELGSAPPTAGANSLSTSAVGHRAFIETLRRLGEPVVISRNESGAKAGSHALLLIAEPSLSDETLASLDVSLERAGRVLVVLPKWDAVADPERPTWIQSAELLPEADLEPLLQRVGAHGSVVRAPAVCADAAGRTADLPQPQLIDDSRLEPIIACGGGILVGRVPGVDRSVWVLSDPDLISNHGLGRGDNALIAVALLDQMHSRADPIVVDETIHGFRSEPSVARALFDYPLVLATVQGLFVLAALLLAATRRFGAPLPPPPALAAGKQFLIENTASLLHFGGHAAHTLGRYLDTHVREVGRTLHAPADLSEAELRAWLDRVGQARGATLRLADLDAEAASLAASRRPPAQRVRAAAARAHRWKQEMLRELG